MTDDQPSGSCVVCRRRDAPPELAPVCAPCRSWLPNILLEISHLTSQLHEDITENVLASGSGAPRVGGSRERALPIRPDVTDLLAAARSETLTLLYPEQLDDQVGELGAATVLDGWCRDFANLRRETAPPATVDWQCGYLINRTEWACNEHPAVDEYARELRDLAGALRRAAGEVEPHPDYKQGIPCRYCNTIALVQQPGSDYVDCGNCGRLYSTDEYTEWTTDLARAHRRARTVTP
jgi:hypothetical protein